MLATTSFCLRVLLYSREEQVMINLTFNSYTVSDKVTGIQNATAVVSIDDYLIELHVNQLYVNVCLLRTGVLNLYSLIYPLTNFNSKIFPQICFYNFTFTNAYCCR